MTIHSGGFESSDDSGSSYTTGSEDEEEGEYASDDDSDDAPEGPAPTHDGGNGAVPATPMERAQQDGDDDSDYEHGFSTAKAMVAARRRAGEGQWAVDYGVLGSDGPLAEQMKAHMFRDLDRVPAEYVFKLAWALCSAVLHASQYTGITMNTAIQLHP